jgi:DNA-binding transcriptional ArsR family regulator
MRLNIDARATTSMSPRPLPSLRKDHFDIDAMMESAHEASGFLKALAHEGRLLILCLLIDGEKSVGEIEDMLSLRQPAISQQLARLRADGLVETRREGKIPWRGPKSATSLARCIAPFAKRRESKWPGVVRRRAPRRARKVRGSACALRESDPRGHAVSETAVLEHDPEKWNPVFRKDHAQTKARAGCRSNHNSSRSGACLPRTLIHTCRSGGHQPKHQQFISALRPAHAHSAFFNS